MSKPSKRPSRQKLASRPQSLADYQHKQPANALLGLIGIPLLVCSLAAWNHPDYRGSLVSLCVLMVIGAFLFASLSISVTADTLHWRFGPGLIRKQLPLNEIASAEMTRSTWLEGWGIHYTRRGWLYNVSGRDAILITQKSGKSFLLGTDDVVGLWEALQHRI